MSSAVSSAQMVPMYNPSQPLGSSGPTYAQNPSLQYSPVVHHWFFCKEVADQSSWLPFSYRDSMALEESFLNGVQYCRCYVIQRHAIIVNIMTNLVSVYFGR